MQDELANKLVLQWQELNPAWVGGFFLSSVYSHSRALIPEPLTLVPANQPWHYIALVKRYALHFAAT